MLNDIGDILGDLFYCLIVSLFGYVVVRILEGLYTDNRNTPQEIKPLDKIDEVIIETEKSFDNSFLFWYPWRRYKD